MREPKHRFFYQNLGSMYECDNILPKHDTKLTEYRSIVLLHIFEDISLHV